MSGTHISACLLFFPPLGGGPGPMARLVHPGASLPGALEPAGEAGGAVAPPSAPVETVSSPKRKKKDARDRTKDMRSS